MIGSQLRLYDQPPASVPRVAGGLRPYQQQAVDGIFRELVDLDKRATLLVLPTGSGKTRTATAAVREWLHRFPSDRVLWLAESDFLIDDARTRLAHDVGEYPSTEKAGQRADGSKLVVGSVQTLRQRARRESWRRDHFGLIVYDEAKSIVAPGARAICEWFTGKLLGMDATPQRLDGVGQWNVFGDSLAIAKPNGTPLDVAWAIHEGYFVPPIPVARYIKEIDMTAVSSAGGDLNLTELEHEIAKNAAAIAKCTLRDCGDRSTIVYTPGRASAHAVAATLNEAKPGSAVAVDQETPSEVRKRILKDFNAGKIQYICNCMIYRQGLDVPICSAIVIARLTKSSALYTQFAGRGGRPEAGIGELETREERIAAIAASSKPNFILLDITGKPSRHKLISPADVLGGKEVRGELKERAKKILAEQPDAARTMDEVFALAEEELAEEDKARRKMIAEAALAAKVKARKRSFDPFRRVGVHAPTEETGEAPKWTAEPPTQDDLAWLKKNRLATKGTTKGTVAVLQKQARAWYASGMATFGQRNQLSRLGCPVDVTFVNASALITLSYQNGNGRYPVKLTQGQIDSVLKRQREPGEEG